jgi:hypothetical protein
VNVFFDNCTSPVLASTLDGFIEHLGHRAFHIKDVPSLRNGRHSTDLEWIAHLRDDNIIWIFITGDGRVLKNKAERQALRGAGLHGFVLPPAHQKTPLNQVAAQLVLKWPEVEAVIKLVQAPSMHEIPIGRSRKLKSLPI